MKWRWPRGNVLQHSSHLRGVPIHRAILQRFRIRPVWRQALARKSGVLRSPRLLKVLDILVAMTPSRRVQGVRGVDRVTQHYDDHGARIVCHDPFDRHRRIQIHRRCFAGDAPGGSGIEQHLVRNRGIDATGRPDVRAEELGLFERRHEDRRMLRQILEQRCRAAFGGSGNEEIGPRTHVMVRSRSAPIDSIARARQVLSQPCARLLQQPRHACLRSRRRCGK